VPWGPQHHAEDKQRPGWSPPVGQKHSGFHRFFPLTGSRVKGGVQWGLALALAVTAGGGVVGAVLAVAAGSLGDTAAGTGACGKSVVATSGAAPDGACAVAEAPKAGWEVIGVA
jgi:hypothetical protein